MAVFPSPGKLTKRQMQLIAREMNFSETTFIFKAKASDADAAVRIFTPGRELQFAGHPVLGTAYVVAMQKKGKKKPEKIVLEIGLGRIEVDLYYSGSKIKRLVMHQPIPTFGFGLQNRGQAARALGIKAFDIIGGGVVSNGADFLIIEVQTKESVGDARLNIDETINVITRHAVNGIYLFARMEGKKSNVHARFFGPTIGVFEDPATGSAAGALGGYVARIMKFPSELELLIDQGAEMQRPSKISVHVRCDRGMIGEVLVSGQAAHVGEGTIFLT